MKTTLASPTPVQHEMLLSLGFKDWLYALAKIAEPDDPAHWLVHSVVLNEECWFDYFKDGITPSDCWAEECSYD